MSIITTHARSKAAPAKSVAKRAIAVGAFAPSNKPGAKRGGVVPPMKPSVRVKTLRLNPTFEEGLVILKGVLHKPLNKMVNEAVGEYIERRAAEAESQLTTTLKELRAYRRADPEFSAARNAFIEGEVRFGKADPMEGRVVTPTPPSGVTASRGDLPPIAVPTELRKSGVARLVDLRSR